MASRPPTDALERFAEAALEVVRLAPKAKALPTWTPQDGPQREFYDSTADEVLYGGAAGGGKTSCVVALILKWVAHSQYRALLLRRETPQLEGLLDEASRIYKRGNDGGARPFRASEPAAEFNIVKSVWTFPSGARARFNHCQLDADAFNYQGHEYQTIVFDELTHFTEKQYLEIRTRNRSGVAGIPCYTRATTNPGGPGHEWTFKRWAPWLDPSFDLDDWIIDAEEPDESIAVVAGRGLPKRFDESGKRLPPARGGQVLYVARVGDVDRFSTRPFRYNGEAATTRTFIPARLSDNPALLASDPKYRAKLRDNDAVRRRQLEDGDWLVKPSAGLYFKREWFGEPVDAAPPGCIARVRAWDKAATEPHEKNKNPDWTRGLRMSRSNDGLIYVEHMASLRGGPGPVAHLIKTTAAQDGVDVIVRLPQDPAAAGKSQAASDVQMLEGYTVRVKPVTGDKIVRAGPVSTQANPQSTGGSVGRLRVVRGSWNEEFFRELEDFPDGDYDDIVDALSDGFDELKDARPPAPPPPPVQQRNWESEGIGFG